MGGRSSGRANFGSGEGGSGKLTAALAWSLDHSEEWRAAKEAGFIPEELDPPEMLEGFGGWYSDFWRLSSERQIGFGVGPIPQGAIDRHVAGWHYEDVAMFEHCIREMDSIYLMRANKSDDATPPATANPMEAFRSTTSSQRGR